MCSTSLARQRDTGFILAEAEGEALHYRWTGPDSFSSTSARDTVFVAGKYYVTVEDKYYCKSVDSVEVKDLRLQKSYRLQIDSFSCQRDTAIIRIDGDSLLVSTTWERRDTIVRDVYEIVVLHDDTIYTTFIDRGGCVWQDTVVLIDSFITPKIEVSTKGISCDSPRTWIDFTSSMPVQQVVVLYPDGTVDTFNPSNAHRIPTSMGGLHLLTFFSKGACPVSSWVEVHVRDSFPQFQLIGDTLNCIKTKALLRVEGDSSDQVRWTGPGLSDVHSPTLEIAEGGWYYVEVENAEGCRVRDSIFVPLDTTPPQVTLPQKLVLNCYKLVDTVAVALPDRANTLIEWYTPRGERYTGEDTIVIDRSGAWGVHLRSTNGCATWDTLWVFYDTSRPKPSVEIQSIDCIHRQAAVRIASEHVDQWQWKGPSDTAYSLGDSVWTTPSGGKVFYRLRYRNGCWREDSITIEVDTLPPRITLYEDSLTCQRDTLSLRADIHGRWDSLLWMGPNGFRSMDLQPLVEQEGEYRLKVFGSNGCTAEASTTIFRTGSVPKAELSYRGWLDCKARRDTLRVNDPQSGWKYRWITPNGTSVEDRLSLIIADSGKYELIVVDANGCTGQYSVVISLDTTAPHIEWSVDTLTCIDTAGLIEVVSGDSAVLSYRWWGPSGFTFVGKTPHVLNRGGLYVVEYTGSNGCTQRDTLDIPEDRAAPMLSVFDDTLSCAVDSVLLRFHTDIDHYQLRWMYGGRIFSTTANAYAHRSGTYVLALINPHNGCITIDSLYIAPPRPIEGVEIQAIYDCELGVYTLALDDLKGGTAPYSIRINGQPHPVQSQPWRVPSGQSSIQIVDSKGCVYDTVVLLDSIVPLEIQLIDSIELDYDSEVRLTVQVNRPRGGITHVEWQPTQGLSCADCLDPVLRAGADALYVCTIEDVYGCTDSAAVYVKVRVPLEVYFPNVINTSADALNNKWKPHLPAGQSGWIEALDIFDRWGERVYALRRLKVEDFAGWDGRLRGKLLPPGVYVYRLRLRLEGQIDTKTYMGQITLIR